MKIFVIAFACEPNRTSEPGVGWNVVREMSKRHRLIVVTRANNKESVMSAWCGGNVDWLFFDLPRWFCWLKKRIPYGSQIYQEFWNRKVARRFAEEMRSCDIVHQVTFGAAFFTPWAARYAKKFVWGPLGGGDKPIPRAFTKRMGVLAQIKEWTYGFISKVACQGAFWSRGLRNKVDAVVFRTKEFSKRMNLRDDVDVSVICETAYTKSIVTRQYNIAKIPLQVMIVGRLIPHKAPDFAVRAFSRFISNGGEGELHIYGGGPLRSRLEKQAMSVLNPGVQRRRGKVIFHGNVPNAEVLKALDSADVMLHLSFREGGSWSMLEAMAHGLPVVCQRASGMDDMVTDNCGFKIAASNPDSLIEEAAGRLMEYYSRRDLLRAHGVEAQKRVSSIYRWENVANQIDEVYSRITGGGNAK